MCAALRQRTFTLSEDKETGIPNQRSARVRSPSATRRRHAETVAADMHSVMREKNHRRTKTKMRRMAMAKKRKRARMSTRSGAWKCAGVRRTGSGGCAVARETSETSEEKPKEWKHIRIPHKTRSGLPNRWCGRIDCDATDGD